VSSRTLIGPLGISLVCIVACAIALLIQVPPIFGALVQPKAQTVSLSNKVQTIIESEHPGEVETLQKRFNGRSAFFIPDRPVIRVERRDDRPAPEPPKPRVEEAPAQYGGSLKPVWSVEQNIVICTEGSKEIEVKIGEQRGDTKLVSVNLPYSVTLEWTKPPQGHISYKTGTYTINFREGLFGGSNPALLATAPKEGTRKLEGGGPVALPPSREDEDPRSNRFRGVPSRDRSQGDEDAEDN